MQIDIVKALESLTIFKVGPAFRRFENQEECFSAKFRLSSDISSLFPYLNAMIGGAEYYGKPEHIKLSLYGCFWVLSPTEGAFTPVSGYGEAVECLKELINYLSETYSKKDEIVPNYRQQSPPASALDIFKLLPASNCQKCGYATCISFAAALSRKHTAFSRCPFLANPVEEKVTFQLTDNHGKKIKRVSIPIDTDCLRSEVAKKEDQIEMLERQLAELEYEHAGNREEANAKLDSPLTKREIEVLQMLTLGATNKEISKQLFVSQHTIKSHILHIFEKLGVNDRTQASVWAVKNGFF